MMSQDWESSKLSADSIPDETPKGKWSASNGSGCLGLVIVTAVWLWRRRSYGSLAGLISGALMGALTITFYGITLDGPDYQPAFESYDLLVPIGAFLGIIGGTLMGFIGNRIATTTINPQRGKTGAILGGFIGGILICVVAFVFSLFLFGWLMSIP